MPSLRICRTHGQNLERVSLIRDFGVLMDSKLTFSKHVDVTVSKARQMLGFIMRVGKDGYGCLIRIVVLQDWREFRRSLFCMRYVDLDG
jgi:hypothetical protein